MSMTVTANRLRERGHEIVPVCYPNSPIHERLKKLDFEPLLFDLWGKFHPFKAFRVSRVHSACTLPRRYTQPVVR